MQAYGLHWFRRDLRVAGNQALKWNYKKNQGAVIGLFCFDKEFLSRPDFSIHRFQFFLETLAELKKELKQLGSDLLILDEGPLVAFSKLFNQLRKQGVSLPQVVTWSRDYEPYARERDGKVQVLLQEQGVRVETFRDHLLIEPHELSKDNGEGYQVYSPFAKKWLELFHTESIQKRLREQQQAINYYQTRNKEKLFSLTWSQLLKGKKFGEIDVLEQYRQRNNRKVVIEVPKAGSHQAFHQLETFRDRLDSYSEARDFPAHQGTSRFSIFLKNGSLTVPQIIHFFNLQAYKKKQKSQDTFLSELIWREFYYHILYRHPYVEGGSFLRKLDAIAWENDNTLWTAWQEGLTGFPIVDAGMRELKNTGWMHNRVRMIVASFLTKDLLIDWRWGEKYFMEQLLDGDLAPNNGGWQWAASTGCDPQPYFRIFNPWLQSKKFDPQSKYIHTYLPELKGIEARKLHEPILHVKDYPKPVVEHSQQRLKALKMYQVLK